MASYCRSAVDARGHHRVVRIERVAPEEFCFDSAQVGSGWEGLARLGRRLGGLCSPLLHTDRGGANRGRVEVFLSRSRLWS